MDYKKRLNVLDLFGFGQRVKAPMTDYYLVQAMEPNSFKDFNVSCMLSDKQPSNEEGQLMVSI